MSKKKQALLQPCHSIENNVFVTSDSDKLWYIASQTVSLHYVVKLESRVL